MHHKIAVGMTASDLTRLDSQMLMLRQLPRDPDDAGFAEPGFLGEGLDGFPAGPPNSALNPCMSWRRGRRCSAARRRP